MTRFAALGLGLALWFAAPEPHALVRGHWRGSVVSAQAADLAALEAALSAHPDDLRAADVYRAAVIQQNQYDRAIAFFAQLVASHPTASNAHLNYAFAYVDKIPAAGAITQVILANNALSEFTKALEIQPSWIGYFTRGNSYLFWPRIFGRTGLGIADLEAAMKLQAQGPKRAYYARTYVSLGDGHWKIDEFDKATDVWRQGLALFPDNPALKQRLAVAPDQLKPVIDAAYDPAQRVDTSLKDLWAN